MEGVAAVISGPARWYTVGGHLVSAVRTALTVTVSRYGQVPGDIAWDNCTCEGVLAVTVPRIYLSEVFPNETEGPVGVRCQAPYEVAEFTVSVIRCAPQPDGVEAAPPAAELDAAAAVLLRDMTETLDALSARMCQLHDNDDVTDYLITPAESAGPEGGCVGFTQRVLVALDRA